MPTLHQSNSSGGQPVKALAYLVSTYPTLSMTFVLREVLQLRELGFRIETASVNPPECRPTFFQPPAVARFLIC